MDVKQNIMTAAEIRAELATRKMSKASLAKATKINYNYLVQILNDMRDAEAKRRKITKYLKGGKAA